MKPKSKIVVAVLGAVCLAAFWFTRGGAVPVFSGVSPSGFHVSADNGTSSEPSFANGFAPVASKALPAVVNIASSRIIRTPSARGQSPFFDDPVLRRFFGDEFPGQSQVPREQRARSRGSGVIVSADGYVLTNHHVVENAVDINISLGDKREFKGRVIGTDPRTDVAVIKIEASNLPVLSFGDSSKVKVGDFALAIGNPFGVGQTVTMGIISATGRAGLGIEDYEDFIQTDAAVNPGNSGGALVNVRGELIGINTAILSGAGGGNQGVGFAIPANMAHAVMAEILKHGKVTRGSIGVGIQPVTPQIAKAFALPGNARGALVVDVNPNSPAEHSGILRGDIILGLNGTPVNDSQDLRLRISLLPPNTSIKLQVFRDGRESEVSVTLTELAAEKHAEVEVPGKAAPSTPFGLSVQALTSQVTRQLGLPAGTTGVLVAAVDPGSSAEEAGVQHGDVIQEVDRKPVSTPEQFSGAIQRSGKQPVLLLINRGGNHLYVALSAG